MGEHVLKMTLLDPGLIWILALYTDKYGQWKHEACHLCKTLSPNGISVTLPQGSNLGLTYFKRHLAMSSLMNEEALLDAVSGCPGATAGEIAPHLDMDRCNVRRHLKKLWRDGKVTGQDDGGKFRFYPAGTAQSYAPPLSNAVHGGAAPIVDVVDYKDITNTLPPPSPSRALVPVVAGQPYDSRTAAALRQHAAARRLKSQPENDP
jgi:DNA-binding transcriptional ArsR family regulator